MVAVPEETSSADGVHSNQEKNSLSDRANDTIVATTSSSNQLHRHLGNRQIQLIAIGGSIGTALFVSIGNGLLQGGPANLFLAYTIYSCFLGCVNNGMAEMCCYMPISSSYIRMAGKWVDEAFGFMAGWNFFLYEAILIPFEISALNLVLEFWWPNRVPEWAVCIICIFLYAVINVVAVKYFGEAEFWLASGKLLLIFIVFGFTFVTMVGGNPQNDPYGFRYWYEPGSFKSRWAWLEGTPLGNFTGFLAGVYSAGFTVVGPEYLAMVAGEARRPRAYIKQGFKTVYWRFGFFFIGGALCCGIILPYNSADLAEGGNGAAGSPYVIAMNNMGIQVLPHFINALLCSSIFSAGNAYTYCAMRSLYGLSLEGQAPRIFSKTLKNGIPIYAFGVTMLFPLLSFMQTSNQASKVVGWLQGLTQAAQMINYVVMSITYIFFFKACKAQGLDRSTLPYVGYFQPYCAYLGVGWMTFVVFTYGYHVFVEPWDTLQFFIYYAMLIIAICTFTFWKLFKRTSFVRPEQADLIWEKPLIDAYEEQFTEPPSKLRDELLEMMRIRKKRQVPAGEANF